MAKLKSCALVSALVLSTLWGCTQNSLTSRSPNQADKVTAEGQDRGNGTDVIFESDTAAWFVGSEKTITYCLQRSDDFGPSLDQAADAIQSAFNEWGAYHRERSWSKKLATQARRVSKCAPDTDVTFILGGSLPTGDKTNRHVGLAVKTSYESLKSWGQGYIWLPSQGSIPNEIGTLPNWTEASLKGVLLHEIGHVYGVSHIDGTIMEEGAGRIALNADPKEELPTIDGPNFLLPPVNEVAGVLGVSADQNPNLVGVPFADPEQNFKLLMGRTPAGPVSATIQFSADLSEGYLKVGDSQETAKFELKSYLWEKAPPLQGSKSVFVTRTDERYYVDSSFSTVKGFYLTSHSGKIIDLNLHFNQPTGFKFEGHLETSFYQTGGIAVKASTNSGPVYLFTTSVKKWSGATQPTTPNPNEGSNSTSSSNSKIELSVTDGGIMLPIANETCSDRVKGNGERSANSVSLSLAALHLKWKPVDRILYIGMIRVTVSGPQILGGSYAVTLPGNEVEALLGSSGQIVTPVNDDGTRGNKEIVSDRSYNRSGFPACAFNIGGLAIVGSGSSFAVDVKVDLLGQASDEDGSNPEVIRATYNTTATYF